MLNRKAKRRMNEHPLIKILNKHPEYTRLVDALKKGEGSAAVFGLGEAVRAHIAAGLFCHTGKTVLIITANESSAARIQQDMAAFTDRAYHLPARELPLGAKGIAASAGLTARRLEPLCALLNGENIAVAVSAEALIQRMTPPAAIAQCMRTVSAGDRTEPRELLAALINAGYERVDMCEGKGQVCLRGGYLDVFPISMANPVRIEFFDDEIDTMRTYDAVSQRSIENIDRCVIPPATEMPLTKEARTRGMRALRKAEGMKEEYDRLSEGGIPLGLEMLLPLFYPEAFITDYLPEGAIILIDEPQRVEESAKLAFTTHLDRVGSYIHEGTALPEQAELICQPSRILQSLDTPYTAMLFALTRTYGLIKPKCLFRFETRPMAKYIGNTPALAADIESWKRGGSTVMIYAGAHAKRIGDMLGDEGVTIGIAEALTRDIISGEQLIVGQSIARGFEYPELRLAVISECELYGTESRRSASASKKKPKLAFSELSVGDLVVHELHGIGRFVGVVTLQVAGVSRDYLHLVYAGGDKLYVPTDQLDRVQKYIGGDETTAHLSHLGTGEWQRTVNKTRESVKKLAFDLVKLYGDRLHRKGHAFPPDTAWQKRLEESFPYQETPDQLTSIAEIKKDMESDRVMDRLLCGDVGYGKTEVALRAAFKAVTDSKQVAFLVPTTILAQQHYNTLAARFSGFPVNVALLSRFNTPSEEARVIDGLKKGTIDVVVGTHKLLSKSVRFKDLGLLIIDEEQRFGVGHKEQIKEMRKDIDALTLSATPIPRTLHMSMTGIRDMSVIETPPEQRYPVQTYVMEYSEAVAREAIMKELGRGGQVFFVYNNVRGMETFAEKLKQLVPEARIAYAHGQMGERQLERTMLDFMEQQYDVLLCSTIIESGLDIPNVNTIIIYDADKMGLAQLYQLRGRVGRGARLGYAYLTFMRDKVLSDIAEKRLSAIREFTQFGAGFKIAMRDLEIRGAGNLLGPEQHGHMAAVGYDLYCKIVEGAVKEAKGEKEPVKIDTVVDIPVPASISTHYIPRESERLSMYKRIALIETRDDLYDVQDELIDRYGDIPEDTANLLNIALIKADCSRAGVTQLRIRDKEVRFVFDKQAPIDGAKLIAAAGNIAGARMTFGDTPSMVISRPKSDAAALYAMLPQFVYMLADCLSAN